MSLADRQRPVNQIYGPLGNRDPARDDGVLRPAPEGNGGIGAPPSVFSRGGSLLPSSDADVHCHDNVITFEGRLLPTDLRKIGTGQEILAKMHARFVFSIFLVVVEGGS